MKTKYPKAVWLIVMFYLLVVLVGGGQIFWAFRFGDDYKTPTMDGFYMIYRLALSLLVVGFFALRRRDSLYWTIIIESTTNIFAILFSIYEVLWHICQSRGIEHFRLLVSWYGIGTGWNAILGLISIVILGYIIASWKQLMSQQPATS